MNHDKRLVCRVCLNYEKVIFTGIFHKINETLIYEMINLIANINIKPQDGLPDQICSDCLSELENAIAFRQKCETSNNILTSEVHTNIGIPKQEVDFPEVPIKYELDEYVEDMPDSPSEQPFEPEESNIQEQLHIPPELTHTQKPPSRPRRALDLKLECNDCGTIYDSKSTLREHYVKTHLKAQLTCNICGISFRSFKKLKNHQLNKTKRCATLSQVRIEGEGKSRVYHCKECDYSSNYDATMTKHLALHSGECMYPCTLCPAKYVYINSLDAHMESKHGVFKKSVVCNICGETMGKRKFYKHMRKHKVGNLAKCDICNKEFKYKHYLKIHMERHAGVKKYPCDKCDKSFITGNNLYNHVRSVHDQKRFTYNCDVCKFTNNNRKIMYNHKVNHSKYHYVCDICGKFFENDTQLSSHVQLHNNKHPCQHCEETFPTKKLLLTHMNEVHKVK